MKNKIYTILALMLVVCATSCREDMPEMQNPNSQYVSNWDGLFDCFWKGMNYNYIFWDIDETDWDEVYANYQPLFEGIADEGFNDEETNQQALEWMAELSSTLVDHHLTITLSVGNNTYLIDPGGQEVASREGYREAITTEEKLAVLYKMNDEERFYGSGIRIRDDEDSTDRYYITGLLESQIVYFTFNQFLISEDIENEEGDLREVYDSYNDMLDNHQDLKGVIIDVRGNGGGYLDDICYVLGKFVSEPLNFAFTKMKSGIGRLDYTNWTPEFVFPAECNRSFDDIPIVILADMHSISMAEMTTMAVLQLPAGNGVFIGERTNGGTGPIISPVELSFGGSFSNDVISVEMSSTNLVDASGNSYEGYGLTPTIECPLDTDLLSQGVDNQLERAITYIKTGN